MIKTFNRFYLIYALGTHENIGIRRSERPCKDKTMTRESLNGKSRGKKYRKSQASN